MFYLLKPYIFTAFVRPADREFNGSMNWYPEPILVKDLRLLILCVIFFVIHILKPHFKNQLGLCVSRWSFSIYISKEISLPHPKDEWWKLLPSFMDGKAFHGSQVWRRRLVATFQEVSAHNLMCWIDWWNSGVILLSFLLTFCSFKLY